MADKVTPSCVMFDGMTWPHPDDPLEIAWTLRYGTPTKSELMRASSYISAYCALVWKTQRDRNSAVSGMKQALRAGSPDMAMEDR